MLEQLDAPATIRKPGWSAWSTPIRWSWKLQAKEEVVHIANIIVPRLKPDNTGQANWCEAEGQKAIAAKQFIYQQIQATTEIAVDEQNRQPNGDLKAVVYLNNVSLGQELLYKSLAIEAGQKHNWCKSL